MATIKANVNFDVLEAANELIQSMDSGKDEEKMINVTVTHDVEQRLHIKERFTLLTGKFVEKQLASSLSGNMEACMIALYTPVCQFLANIIIKTLKGKDTDDSILLEILCTLPASQLFHIKEEFSNAAGRSLEDAILKDGGGRMDSILATFMKGEGAIFTSGVVGNEVKADALMLFQAGKARFEGEKNIFMHLFAQRSFAHMAEVYKEYQVISGIPIIDVITKETKGKQRDGLLALVQLSSDMHEFFAARINAALKGMIPDGDDLIRIFVARCEIDLLDIEAAFATMFEKTLDQSLKKIKKKDFEDLMLAILAKK